MASGDRKDKLTYPPLFEAGFTHVSEADIERVFVGVAESSRRKMLASQLRLFIQKLRSLGVKGELWIDGSFSTKNLEPMDIDLLLVIPRIVLSAMTEENLKELDELTGNRELTRARWSCDLYVIESSNIARRKYYEDFFSQNPDKDNRKGIPVIKL
ncbi:DUF6932 family protein [Cellvibrio japonicus]|nr:hypothetical protein [Cellvibrio japonicus]QEI13842.1 hypothetical protein FY117_17555 [Cellvibrio japonicus]QEI17416.1 hypothetical protein FY116_17560 [Cellvibrio japonicus]QEI20992.1 hypothetical protein FY115_17555 [Cellvibrio japonicus]